MSEYSSIYDRYNAILASDQPYVDTCVTAIQAQIDTTIAAKQKFSFPFDLSPYIGSIDQASQIRIKDRIIFTFRELGIGCFILYTGTMSIPNVTSSNTQPFAINFNSEYINTSLVLLIRWFIRNDTEFGKSYV
jgi:hypothetical protein